MSTTTLQPAFASLSRRSIFSSSPFVWLLLVGYLVLVKIVVLPLFPPTEIDSITAILDGK